MNRNVYRQEEKFKSNQKSPNLLILINADYIKNIRKLSVSTAARVLQIVPSPELMYIDLEYNNFETLNYGIRRNYNINVAVHSEELAMG